jgi:NADH/NAD ratio-sensing transcriptional regulator Rex
MKLTDTLIGKDIKSILPFITKDTIYCVNVINSSSDIAKEMDELRKYLNKHSSNKYTIITLKGRA